MVAIYREWVREDFKTPVNVGFVDTDRVPPRDIPELKGIKGYQLPLFAVNGRPLPGVSVTWRAIEQALSREGAEHR